MARTLSSCLYERLSRLFTVLLLISSIDYKVWADHHTQNFNTLGSQEHRSASASSNTLKVFTDRDGLPQNSVMAAMFDQTGRLWIGTQDGAAYYNGHSWQQVSLPDPDRSNYIMQIVQTTDSMWFATWGGGLHRLYKGEWTSYNTENSQIPSNLIGALSPGINGSIWIGTDNGLSRLDENRWLHFNTSSGLPGNKVQALFVSTESSREVVWAGTSNGLACLQDGKWRKFNTDSGLPNNNIRTLLQTGSGSEKRLWVGTDAGLAVLKDGKWEGVETGFSKESISAILESKGVNGNLLWAGTISAGIAYLEDGHWRQLDNKNGLPSNAIGCMASAPDGSIWIGTMGGGLVKTRIDGWKIFNTDNGLPNNIVWALASTTDESYWIGTDNGLVHLENEKWRVYTVKDGLPNNSVWALAGESSDGLWVGTANGLAKRNKGRWITFTTKDGLPNNQIVCLLEEDTKDRTLWVGTNSGLARLEGNKWTVYNTLSGLPNNSINALLEVRSKSGKRSIWIGTHNGLAKFEDGVWTAYDTRSGLPNNNVWAILEVDRPTGRELWAGTSGGIARLKLDDPSSRWSRLPIQLPSKIVMQMRRDSSHIYIFTTRGIARLTPNTSSIEDGSEFLVTVYTMEDGLPSNSINQGASMIDRRGRVWAGTILGAAVQSPANETVPKITPALVLEQVYINDKPYAEGVKLPLEAGFGTTALSYLEHNLSFEVALLSYYREADTRYKTQLYGFDPQPSQWNTSPRRTYTNLPAGNYIFKVWAKDYTGTIIGPLEVRFSIKPALWNTWWAYILYVLGLTGSGLAAYRWQMRRIEAKERARLEAIKLTHNQRLESLRLLLESIRIINSQLSLDPLLLNIAAESARLIDAEPGSIGLVEGDKLVFKLLWNQGVLEPKQMVFPIGKGVAGKVAETGKPYIVNDPDSEPNVLFPEEAKLYAPYGFIDVPIIDRKGQVVGVLDVRRPKDRPPFTEADLQMVELLTHQAAVAIENASLYDKLEQNRLALEEKNLIIAESLKELENLYHNEQKVTRALQDLNQMKTNFMIVTSHELRTPLSVLRSYFELLLDEEASTLNPSQRESLEFCQAAVERIVESVDSITEMLQIHEGRIELHRSEFDLCGLITEVAQELEPFIRQRSQKLELKLPPSLLIQADAARIRSVLVNLLQNAIKFSYDGGHIEIEACLETSGVTIAVRDEGIGIAPEELERIFEKFYTHSDTSKHTSGKFKFSARGAGLGLSIARSYIEAHGGKIYAESKGLGQGSVFRIHLPLTTSA